MHAERIKTENRVNTILFTVNVKLEYQINDDCLVFTKEERIVKDEYPSSKVGAICLKKKKSLLVERPFQYAARYSIRTLNRVLRKECTHCTQPRS
jgi:hypothetical protein